MNQVFVCHCGAKLKITPEMVNRLIRCPKCEQEMEVLIERPIQYQDTPALAPENTNQNQSTESAIKRPVSQRPHAPSLSSHSFEAAAGVGEKKFRRPRIKKENSGEKTGVYFLALTVAMVVVVVLATLIYLALQA